MNSDELKAALIDANEMCRTALYVLNGLAIRHDNSVSGFNVGGIADAINRSLKRQHDTIMRNGGYDS